MSEASLAKIQNECTKLESELAVYKQSKPISEACNAIVGYISSQPEPLAANRAEPNPWTSSGGGGGGGCVIC